VVVAEAQELDQGSERRTWLQPHSGRAATLVRKHKIIQHLEGKRLAGGRHVRWRRDPRSRTRPRIRSATFFCLGF
jgi:hypothetical protein